MSSISDVNGVAGVPVMFNKHIYYVIFMIPSVLFIFKYLALSYLHKIKECNLSLYR